MLHLMCLPWIINDILMSIHGGPFYVASHFYDEFNNFREFGNAMDDGDYLEL